jgi:3-methyladenine DNA glycosylase AlkD
MSLAKIKKECQKNSNSKRAKLKQQFFKTGKGEYGEGDKFLGVSVPQSRRIAKEFSDISQTKIKTLLSSEFHEERFIALVILQAQYFLAVKKADLKYQEQCFKTYYSLRRYVNNWDLVDSTAPYISGHYFYEKNPKLLVSLATSKSLWDRRIAILSLFYYIRQKDFKEAVKIITLRLFDKEDLMHKACGWMLREIGNRDQVVLCRFLDIYAPKMPRTALRYAIEKLTPVTRKKYMLMKSLSI